MELTDWIAILTIILGNGAVMTIIGIIYRHYERKSERDLEARRKAGDYYMPLYGHIAILDELATGYKRSIEKGKAKVFTFKECRYDELSSKQILAEFKKAYDAFSSFYIKKKCEGYEIFISNKLKNFLSDFWIIAESFYEDDKRMKDKKEIDDFHNSAVEATSLMEKLFSLK